MSAVADTRNRIIAAAAELFAERGYAGTSTRLIAERAGVNEVTLFRQFTNKRGILAALGASWQSNMAGFAVEKLPESEDTVGTIEALADIELRQATVVGPVAMRLVLDARTSPEVAEVLAGGPDDNFEGLAEYLAQRQAAGDLRADIDPSVMAEAFFNLTSQAIMSRQVLHGTSEPQYGMRLDEAGRQLLEIFFAGVLASSADGPRSQREVEAAEKSQTSVRKPSMGSQASVGSETDR